MHEKFLSILCCPITHELLSLHKPIRGNNNLIVSGELISPSGTSYPIIRGIPRFVKTEAYSQSFGYEWNKWPRVQFESENTGKPMEGHTLTMWNRITELDGELNAKVCVEFGCGPGRFLELVRRKGGQAVGLDMSLAVEAARKNFENDANVLIVQGDILNPPFQEGRFDIGYSIGVLHHTPDPKTGLANLARLVKKGGSVICSVYPAGGFYGYPSVNRFRKIHKMLFSVFSNLPAVSYSYVSAYLLSPIFNKVRKLKFFERYVRYIEKNILVLLYFSDKRWAYLDIFDAITPSIATTHTFEEVCAWFEDSGCNGVRRSAWNRTSIIGIRT